METIKFKTNIKCGGCIATVTPYLNNLPEITNWEVDINNPEKILTLTINGQLKARTIIDTLNKAGYTAEEI